MAWENPKGILEGFEASTDLSTHQHKLIVVDSNGQAAVSGAAAVFIGSLMNKPNAQGKPASVATSGVVKVEAGAAISIGARLTSNASGQAITAASTNWAGAIALEAAANAGEKIAALLLPVGYEP